MLPIIFLRFLSLRYERRAELERLIADRKTPVYEAGIANLTKDETTMLVHFSKEKTQQFTLVRIQQPEGGQPSDGK